jgi:hypothetical protein
MIRYPDCPVWRISQLDLTLIFWHTTSTSGTAKVRLANRIQFHCGKFSAPNIAAMALGRSYPVLRMQCHNLAGRRTPAFNDSQPCRSVLQRPGVLFNALTAYDRILEIQSHDYSRVSFFEHIVTVIESRPTKLHRTSKLKLPMKIILVAYKQAHYLLSFTLRESVCTVAHLVFVAFMHTYLGPTAQPKAGYLPADPAIPAVSGPKMTKHFGGNRSWVV